MNPFVLRASDHPFTTLLMKPLLLALASIAFLFASQLQTSATPPSRVKPRDIRPERELLITHPSVVDSEFAKYPGPWSFGALVEEIFSKEAARDVVRDWLEQHALSTGVGTKLRTPGWDDPATQWLALQNQTIAAAAVTAWTAHTGIPARPAIWRKVIDPWQARDGYNPAEGKPWSPNFANAPFRLLAIVNRVDLAAPELVDLQTPVENLWRLRGLHKEFTRMTSLATGTPFSDLFTRRGGGGYPGTLNGTTNSDAAGEGRLVFGAVGIDGRPLEGGWTLIFEYNLLRDQATTLPGFSSETLPNSPPISAGRLWADIWHRLGDYEFVDHRYNEMLAQVTRAFTHKRERIVCKQVQVDGSGFAQLRTNEGAFGRDRIFRQFEVREGKFAPAVLPMTPGVHFMEKTRDGGQLLASFLKSTEPLILAGMHSLPEHAPGSGHLRPFHADHAVIPAGQTDFHWDPDQRISRNARRLFSLATCNGCHGADTGCPDGLHVHPRSEGVASKLSDFLRTDGRANRFRDPGVKTAFVKQEEMKDRATIMAALLEPRERRRINTLEDLLRERLRRGH